LCSCCHHSSLVISHPIDTLDHGPSSSSVSCNHHPAQPFKTCMVCRECLLTPIHVQFRSSVSSSSSIIAVVRTPKVCLLDAPAFVHDARKEDEGAVVGPMLFRVLVGELGFCCCAVERRGRARFGVGPCCVELDAPEEAEVAEAKETVTGLVGG
jgi:hypothetical protein